MNQQTQSPEQTQNAQTKKLWYQKWWGKIIVVIIFSIAGISMIGAMMADEQNQPVALKVVPQETKSETKQVPEPEKNAPPISVTSASIFKEYSENEVAADAKYKGKLIEISGKVVSVDNGTFDDEIIVRLSDGQYDFSGPWCYMKESERDKVLALKKGQQVVLIGVGDSATIGSPVLKSCAVK